MVTGNARKRWFAGFGVVIAVAVMALVLTSSVRERQPRVAVSGWSEFTDPDGVTLRNFVLTNAGPGGVEYDTRSYQWTDLPLGDPLSGAFVMGGSGSLAQGTVAVLTFMKPSRKDGQWRFVVACRRSPRPIERLRLHLHHRFPRFTGCSQDRTRKRRSSPSPLASHAAFQRQGGILRDGSVTDYPDHLRSEQGKPKETGLDRQRGTPMRLAALL